MDTSIKTQQDAITAAADKQLAAAAALNRTVREARRAGLSWTQIGAALGTTKQAAQQRFGATTGG
jgi:hypothetical protein